MLSKDLQPYWQREGIAQWREEYIPDIASGAARKPKEVEESIASFENPHMADPPSVGEILEFVYAEGEVEKIGAEAAN